MSYLHIYCASSVTEEFFHFYVTHTKKRCHFSVLKPWQRCDIQGDGIAERPRVETRRLGDFFQPVLEGILMDREDVCCLLNGKVLPVIDLQQMNFTVRQALADILSIAAPKGGAQALQ